MLIKPFTAIPNGLTAIFKPVFIQSGIAPAIFLVAHSPARYIMPKGVKPNTFLIPLERLEAVLDFSGFLPFLEAMYFSASSPVA